MENIELLRELFPNQVAITIEDLADVLSLSTSSLYHRRHRGQLNIRQLPVSGKIRYSLLDIAKWLDGEEQHPKKRRTGRPTKREQVERAQQA